MQQGETKLALSHPTESSTKCSYGSNVEQFGCWGLFTFEEVVNLSTPKAFHPLSHCCFSVHSGSTRYFFIPSHSFHFPLFVRFLSAISSHFSCLKNRFRTCWWAQHSLSNSLCFFFFFFASLFFCCFAIFNASPLIGLCFRCCFSSCSCSFDLSISLPDFLLFSTGGRMLWDSLWSSTKMANHSNKFMMNYCTSYFITLLPSSNFHRSTEPNCERSSPWDHFAEFGFRAVVREQQEHEEDER